MNDVLPECGGYLLVNIDEDGIIRDRPRGHDALVVHRETRAMQYWDVHVPSFVEAKERLDRTTIEAAILQLDVDGGGCVLWVRPEQADEVSARLQRWKGCYGTWPIRTLSL